MKEYDFLCGGDGGAWECTVTVKLSDEEAALLKEEAEKDFFLSAFPPTENIWCKVSEALAEQCDDDLDMNSVVIWIPTELRDSL